MDFRALGRTIITAGSDVATAAFEASGKVIAEANAKGVPDALGIAGGNAASASVKTRLASLLVRLPQGAQAPVSEALTAGLGLGTLQAGKITKLLAQEHIDNPGLRALATALSEGAASAGNGIAAGRVEAGAENIARHVVD
jgi:hypothetical protein